MGIVETIKAMLGIGNEKGTTSENEEPAVTVEQERTATDETENEQTPTTDDEGTADVSEEPAAAGTDAAGSTESLVDEDPDSTEAAEPGEAAGPEPEEMQTDMDEAAPDVDEIDQDPENAASDVEKIDPGTEEAETVEPAVEQPDAAAASDSVEEIKGIGPAYAERLGEVGIETVADLAGADAADIAERAEVPESRVHTWIERASEY